MQEFHLDLSCVPSLTQPTQPVAQNNNEERIYETQYSITHRSIDIRGTRAPSQSHLSRLLQTYCGGVSQCNYESIPPELYPGAAPCLSVAPSAAALKRPPCPQLLLPSSAAEILLCRVPLEVRDTQCFA